MANKNVVDKTLIKARITQAMSVSGKVLHKGLNKPPKTESEIREVANGWLAWSRLNTSFEKQAYPLSLNLNPYRFYKLAEVSEYFAEIMDVVLDTIAMRIERSSREQELDMPWVKEFLPKYSKEYKQQRTDMVTAKIAEGINAAAALQVIMHPFPDSKLVPERVVAERVVNPVHRFVNEN